MRVVESWLRQWVETSFSMDEIAERLTAAGLEVEDKIELASGFSGVVVGEVMSVEPHPNADRLRCCKVNTGHEEWLSIVCGASNVAVGIKVPCALIGARLPMAEGKELVIKPTQLRGVESHGMLCSASELGIVDGAQDGLLILPDSAEVGRDLRDYLKLDDEILEIKLTPNRSDCLSILGIAREVAAVTGARLIPFTPKTVEIQSSEQLDIRVDAPELCGRFAGRVISNVDATAPTPDWMKQRLVRSGMRSISALVDISNYVMLELGQPNHIFDRDKIQGQITARWGRQSESLELLNAKVVSLTEKIGVVADDQSCLAIAGIMGGQSSATSATTQNVFIEAAFWWPAAIQGRSKWLGISTEAGYRFERGVDPQKVIVAIEYISNLIIDICGGQAGPITDVVRHLPETKRVNMRLSRVNRVTGIEFDVKTISAIFQQLGFTFTQQEDSWRVEVPSCRFDIEREEDLIEEVLRIYGYDNIPSRPVVASNRFLPVPTDRRTIHDVRKQLSLMGYSEVVHYSFISKEEEERFGRQPYIELLNPLSENLAVMRSQHIASLLRTLVHNLNQRVERVRIFELARVFTKREGKVIDDSLDCFDQPLHLSLLAYGSVVESQWGEVTRTTDFFDVKNDLVQLFNDSSSLRFIPSTQSFLHPGRSADIEHNGRIIGYIGELHPHVLHLYDIVVSPIVLEVLAEPLLIKKSNSYSMVAKYPVVTKDLAFWCDKSITYARLEMALDKVISECETLYGVVIDYHLFDVYVPSNPSSESEGYKNMAIKFSMQCLTATLIDDTISMILNRIIDGVADGKHIMLRQ